MKKKFLLVILLAVIVAVALQFSSKNDNVKKDEYILTQVEKAPLVINVSEAGSIEPQEQIILKSAVEGRRAIIYIIPEGSFVKKGDLLVELDVSELETKRADQEIVVENAEAGKLIKADDLVVAQNQAKADVELAELKVRFAKEDLQKYIEGEYPKNLSEAEGNVKLAEEELERARDKMEWSKKLFDEKYLSETEMRGDELSWKRAALSLQTAKGNLSLLQNHTYKRQVAQLESDLSQAEMSLERTKRKANASVSSAEASLRAKELEYTRQLERLKHYEKQVANAKIYAPMDGLVIYATSANNRWGNREPLSEGIEVHERNELIYLPTASSFQAEIDVHESNLKKIVPGQKARVRVDAIKDRTFNGVVSHVSPLPDAQKMWQNPDLKVYKTVIKLVDGGELLKSGMNCVAEIIVDQFDEALFIPLQCVVKENGKNIVYTLNSEGEPEAKEVVLGKDNSSVVQVKSGLSEKELVIQNPPLSKSYSDANRTIIEDAPDTKELSEKISSEYEKRMQRRGALTQKTTEAVTNVVSENKAVKPQIEVVAGQ
jgi:HlyD family secretion protein